MIQFLKCNKIILSILLLTILGAALRFYNLNWGAPYYFHPDERNIASAISQLQFPNQMNPHFFAYGTLPIYLVYFTEVVFNTLTHCVLINPMPYAICHTSSTVSFEQAIIGLRILSAMLSVLLIPLMYVLAAKIKNQTTGLLAAFLTTTSIGFIQFAHFGTYESFLTFFTALLFYLCLLCIEKSGRKYLFSLSIVTGILISSKITNLVLLPIPILIIFLSNHKSLRMRDLLFTFYFLFFASLVFILTNPFTFFDFTSFHNSMQYESAVALGTEPVFYTGEFISTIPIVFQMQHVLPFLMTPVFLLLFFPGLLFFLIRLNSQRYVVYFFLLLFLLFTFIPQAILFVKWTRYIVPSLPYFYLILSLFLEQSIQYLRHFRLIFLTAVLCIGAVYAIAFCITVYKEPDAREAAAAFALKHIPSHSSIISEVYDLGITPFNPNFSKITLFNFYDLDTQSTFSTPDMLTQDLQTTSYIILPSQRILKTRLLNPISFPNGHNFYTKLLAGTMGFKKIYQTPCDIWCMITYTGNPVFSYEETASVFDRPVVYIFKKS